MRRIGFAALVALIAAVPVRASVNISCAQVGETNEVIISFDATTETNLVRAFAFDIQLDNDASITEVADNNSECMKDTAPEYADWVEWGRPECWCYCKQCRGDINGSSFFGKPVTLADLSSFKDCFNKPDDELPPGCICADLNHAAFFGKRVTLADLNIFKLYFNKPEEMVPICPETWVLFWIHECL